MIDYIIKWSCNNVFNKLDSIVLLFKVTLFVSYYHIIILSGLDIINCKRDASKT